MSDDVSAKNVTNARSTIVMAILCVAWSLLVARVAVLQLDAHEFRQAANSQRTTSSKIAPRQGRILDRTGRTLAITLRQPSIFVDPSQVGDAADFAQQVGPIIDLEPEDLERTLLNHRRKKFRWLRRRASDDLVQKLESLSLPANSWGFRLEERRWYPQVTVAAHLLGLRDIDGRARGGVEAAYESSMDGTAGARRVVRDSLGRPVSLLSEVSVPAVAGLDVRLSVDAKLSMLVGKRLDECMRQHDAAWSAAIVMNPQTGEIHAAETRPTYEPNDPSEIATGGFHYCFSGAFEPGSTIKPLVVAGALAAGIVSPDSIIDCGPGRAAVGGRMMRDAGALGRQPLADVLARSSNVGAARVAEMLGPQELHSTFRRFGFGQPVPIVPLTDAAGVLRPVSEWSGYSLGSLAMGHEIAVTPLQLAAAYASMTQGHAVRPRLIAGSQGLVEQPPRFLDEPTCEWITGVALRKAVTHGTAKRVAIPGVEVFAKTGTAQKFDPELNKYRTDRATCTVVAGAPAKKPTRIVVVVVNDPSVDPPFSGGRIAGPVARDVLDSALQLAAGL